MMTTYIQQQFARARNLSVANNSDQFTLQIVGLRGHTNWLNITREQLDAIEKILEPVPEVKKPISRRPFYTKERADELAKMYSLKYSSFWYVREVKPNQFEPWAHDLGDAVSTFYAGAHWQA